jgi:hypothetical protein
LLQLLQKGLLQLCRLVTLCGCLFARYRQLRMDGIGPYLGFPHRLLKLPGALFRLIEQADRLLQRVLHRPPACLYLFSLRSVAMLDRI